jgi:pilus assembly protein Flp/PilA
MKKFEEKNDVNLATTDEDRSLLNDTEGATLVEYIILVGVIALIALAGYRLFGESVTTKIGDQAAGVDSINGTAH